MRWAASVVAALVLGTAVGCGLGVRAWLALFEALHLEEVVDGRPDDKVMVVVSARTLAPGATFEEEDLYAVQIDPRYPPAGVYVSPEHVVGAQVVEVVLENEFVRAERIDTDVPNVRFRRASWACFEERDACTEAHGLLPQVMPGASAPLVDQIARFLEPLGVAEGPERHRLLARLYEGAASQAVAPLPAGMQVTELWIELSRRRRVGDACRKAAAEWATLPGEGPTLVLEPPDPVAWAAAVAALPEGKRPTDDQMPTGGCLGARPLGPDEAKALAAALQPVARRP